MSNLILAPEDLSTTWTNVGTTETLNATAAPDGTTTADELVESAAGGSHNIQYPTTAAANIYTYSVFLKANTRDWAILYTTSSNTGKFFNVANGTIGSNFIGAPDDVNIEDYGDGWYRCWMVDTQTNPGCRVYLANADGGNDYVGNGSSGVYVWGAVLELGAEPTPYVSQAGITVTSSTPKIIRGVTRNVTRNATKNLIDF